MVNPRHIPWHSICISAIATFTTSCGDSPLAVRERESWHETATISRDFDAISVRSGDELIGVTDKGDVEIYSTDNAHLISKINVGYSINCGIDGIECSPDGKWIIVLGDSPSMTLIQRSPLEITNTFSRKVGHVYPVSWARDSGHVLTLEFDVVKVRSIPDLKVKSEIRGHVGPIAAAIFSPDGTQIATAGYDSSLRLWTTDGQQTAVLQGHPDHVVSLAYSSDGSRLASGGLRRLRDGRNVCVWNVKTHQQVFRFEHDLHIETLRFAAGDTELFVYSRYKVSNWDTNSGELRYRVDRDSHPMYPDAISPDGTVIASFHNNNGRAVVRIWKKVSDQE